MEVLILQDYVAHTCDKEKIEPSNEYCRLFLIVADRAGLDYKETIDELVASVPENEMFDTFAHMVIGAPN